MTIIYRDKIGYVALRADGDITFREEVAIVDVDEKEIQIPLNSICAITKE